MEELTENKGEIQNKENVANGKLRVISGACDKLRKKIDLLEHPEKAEKPKKKKEVKKDAAKEKKKGKEKAAKKGKKGKRGRKRKNRRKAN